MLKTRVLLAGCMFALSLLPATAETNKINAAKQYGLSYLPLMIMEDQKLVEKHAAALGLNDLKVLWVTLGGPSAMTMRFCPAAWISPRAECQACRRYGQKHAIPRSPFTALPH